MKKIYRASLPVFVLMFVGAIMMLSYSMAHAQINADATLIEEDWGYSQGLSVAPTVNFNTLAVFQGGTATPECTARVFSTIKFDLTPLDTATIVTVTQASLTLETVDLGFGTSLVNNNFTMELWGHVGDDSIWSDTGDNTGNAFDVTATDLSIKDSDGTASTFINLGSVAATNAGQDVDIVWNTSTAFADYLTAELARATKQATLVVAADHGAGAADTCGTTTDNQQYLDSSEDGRALQVPAMNVTAVNLAGTGASSGPSTTVIVVAALVALLSVAGFVVASRKSREVA